MITEVSKMVNRKILAGINIKLNTLILPKKKEGYSSAYVTKIHTALRVMRGENSWCMQL